MPRSKSFSGHTLRWKWSLGEAKPITLINNCFWRSKIAKMAFYRRFCSDATGKTKSARKPPNHVSPTIEPVTCKSFWEKCGEFQELERETRASENFAQNSRKKETKRIGAPEIMQHKQGISFCTCYPLSLQWKGEDERKYLLWLIPALVSSKALRWKKILIFLHCTFHFIALTSRSIEFQLKKMGFTLMEGK